MEREELFFVHVGRDQRRLSGQRRVTVKRERVVFEDEQVRIQCRGRKKLTPHQKEQVEAAARLIELAIR